MLASVSAATIAPNATMKTAPRADAISGSADIARHSGQLANAAIHSAASSASVNGFQLRGFALGARDDMRDMPLLSVLLAARLGSEAS